MVLRSYLRNPGVNRINIRFYNSKSYKITPDFAIGNAFTTHLLQPSKPSQERYFNNYANLTGFYFVGVFSNRPVMDRLSERGPKTIWNTGEPSYSIGCRANRSLAVNRMGALGSVTLSPPPAAGSLAASFSRRMALISSKAFWSSISFKKF
ncbi:MAG: hypothetical protein K0Q50_189 [Vampirovibrio sp.]|nr:hypothetical protein [Vampirovibrio sp.]